MTPETPHLNSFLFYFRVVPFRKGVLSEEHSRKKGSDPQGPHIPRVSTVYTMSTQTMPWQNFLF